MNTARREWPGLSDPGHTGYGYNRPAGGGGGIGRGVNTHNNNNDNNNIQSRGTHIIKRNDIIWPNII